MNIKVKKVNANAVIPTYATDGSAGFDLYAVEDVIIAPGETKKVPLGLSFELPEGYCLLILPRSGLSYKTKLRQPNSVGVIDADYRGEVCMMFDNIQHYREEEEATTVDGEYIIYNVSDEYHYCSENFFDAGSYVINKGDRIAQGIIQEIPKVRFEEVESLSITSRGSGGFGSTGY